MIKTLMKDIFAGVLTLVRVSITSLVFLFIMATAAKADILHVPSEYSTIQAAIDAASGGDEVLAADNVYTGEDNKNLDFMGKAITVRSENGPENCIIDCQGSGRGFYFHSGEDENSVLQGFTIQNGYVDGDWPHDSGGGILCESSSPMIEDNIIKSNQALYSGGGIFCFQSANPTIQSNTIAGNSAFLGGGIYCFRSSPVIEDNYIEANSVGMHGSGVSCSDYSYPTIQSNTITENTGRGGAVECYHYASPAISNNVIARNSGGNGILCFDSSFPTIVNNTIVGNSGIRCYGISCGRFALATVVNTILWNVGSEVHVGDFSSITITYSNVQGGYEGEGNIDAVPQFASLRDGDYRLRPTSPCISAGTNEGAPPFDRDGNRRPNPPGSSCDIGAYESPFGQPAKQAPAIVKKLASTWGELKHRQPTTDNQ